MGWFNSSSANQVGWSQHGYASPGPVPGPARGILARLRQLGAGWLGPRLSRDATPGDEVRKERAAAGPRGIPDLPWFLPYFDNYTNETQAMRLAYRQMWADVNVKAACAGKIFSVAALDLKFLPSDKRDAEARKQASWCDYVFNERIRGGLPDIAWALLGAACTDGYTVASRVWAPEDGGKWSGNWGLKALKALDTGNDLVLQTDEFRNITGVLGLRYNGGLEFSPSDFVIWSHMPLYNQPTGMSDFRAPFKNYWMLDTAQKLRAIGLDKRAYPFVVAKWKLATSQAALEAAVAKAKWQNFISIPDDCMADALNLAGQGDDIFDKAIKSLKHDIFLGIRYAVLQSLEGTLSDARGSSQVHKSEAELANWYLSRALMTIFNDRDSGLDKDLIDLNYPVPHYPKAQLSAVDLNELVLDTQIDQVLSTIVEQSKEDIYERYGREPPKTPEDAVPVRSQQAGGTGGAGGGAGGMGGSQPFVEQINALTAQPKKTFLAEGRAASAHPFRFAEDWMAYLGS